MTRHDGIYLLVFFGILGITGWAVSVGHWAGAAFFGVISLLFMVHMTANLSHPPKFEQVVSLLKAVSEPTGTSSVLSDYDGGEYSSFEAFCDTPIINNRQLNRIRVKCSHLLDDDRFFHRDPATYKLTITKEGSAAVRSLLEALDA